MYKPTIDEVASCFERLFYGAVIWMILVFLGMEIIEALPARLKYELLLNLQALYNCLIKTIEEVIYVVIY